MGCNVSEVGRRRLENLRFPLDCSWARLRRTRLKYARVPTRFVLTDVRRNSTLCPVNSPTFSQYLRKPSFFQDGTSIAVDETFKFTQLSLDQCVEHVLFLPGH